MAGVIENETTYPKMMKKSEELYGEMYDSWHTAMTGPVGVRCPANPSPWTYFHSTPELQSLYKDSTEYVGVNGDIGQMVDHLVELRRMCKEHGRDLYFSRTMLQLEMAVETKKKVALAFVVGMLQGIFHTDLFCEVEFVYGKEKIAAETAAMEKLAKETDCTAVMLVVNARYESTLHEYHTLRRLKRFAVEGFPAYRGARSDFPLIVGLFRKPTTHELGIEVEYQMSHNPSAIPNDKIPLWYRLLHHLTPEEEAVVMAWYPPVTEPHVPAEEAVDEPPRDGGAGARAGAIIPRDE
jgi:hypothetical protein